jgi:hypothetical protein
MLQLFNYRILFVQILSMYDSKKNIIVLQHLHLNLKNWNFPAILRAV